MKSHNHHHHGTMKDLVHVSDHEELDACMGKRMIRLMYMMINDLMNVWVKK